MKCSTGKYWINLCSDFLLFFLLYTVYLFHLYTKYVNHFCTPKVALQSVVAFQQIQKLLNKKHTWKHAICFFHQNAVCMLEVRCCWDSSLAFFISLDMIVGHVFWNLYVHNKSKTCNHAICFSNMQSKCLLVPFQDRLRFLRYEKKKA